MDRYRLFEPAAALGSRDIAERGDYSDRVLLTIHGVASENKGLTNLRSYCEEHLPGLICDSFFYERIVPYRDLSPEFAELIFRSVREKIEVLFHRHVRDHNRQLYIVAHSFGTLAVVRALQMHVPGRIEALILLGSIVPRNQYWDGYVEAGMLSSAPMAVIRPFDHVVRFAGVVNGGSSGALGFISNGTKLPIETYKSGGHVSYDPDDRDDVVQVIRNGARSVPCISRNQWYADAGWTARAYLRLLSLVTR